MISDRGSLCVNLEVDPDHRVSINTSSAVAPRCVCLFVGGCVRRLKRKTCEQQTTSRDASSSQSSTKHVSRLCPHFYN